MPIRPRRISDIKPLLTNLAQTSHYEVQFNALPIDGALKTYLQRKGVDIQFITQSAGLLCYSASLPTTQLASFTVDGNYMGIQEKFAHTRQYDQIGLDFYVDKNYKMLNFLEFWMEFIASGSSINPNRDGYFVRMRYPSSYKVDSVNIVKFDRDYRREIEYNFRGLFPISISSLPVTYSNSDVLKVSASFSYDRYIAGKQLTFNQVISGDSNNIDPLVSQNVLPSPQSRDELLRIRESFAFSPSDTNNQSPRPQPLTDQANALSASFSDTRRIV